MLPDIINERLTKYFLNIFLTKISLDQLIAMNTDY